jgi:hypothetical protein
MVLPAEAREWARQQNWPEPPSVNDADALNDPLTDHQLILTHPDPGSIYHLSPNLPRSAQRIEVGVRAANEAAVAEVTLYVNGVPLQSFHRPPYRTAWELELGEHTFSARGRAVDGRPLISEELRILVRGD